MRKLLAILWKEVVLRFTDPTVLLLAIAMPLAITALVELAFGNLVLGRGIPNMNIPVGVVNQDQGGQWGNFGEIFSQVIISGTETSALPDDLNFELFTLREIEDEARARRMVEREKLIAALFIPPDFSQALANERATIRMYINDRYMFRGVAFEGVVETLANMISTGEVTVRATVKGLMGQPGMRAQLESGELDETLADLALTAAMPESNPIKVHLASNVSQPAQIELTHYLAAAIAILFSGYTALLGSASLLQEKAQWTLQRMVITPTRPGIILGGKALGTYLKGLIQMGALVGGMTAMEWMLSSGPSQAPKINLLGLFLLILVVVAAATGFGVAVAGFARTYAQAASYGAGILLLMALAGGVFFPVGLFPQPMQAVSRLTFHYWAMDGYLRLAFGGSATSILPHIVILGAMGLLLVTIGGWLMRRRVGVF
jgi:ABC-2 type transport system permease protein